jgi:hypothetical protein
VWSPLVVVSHSSPAKRTAPAVRDSLSARNRAGRAPDQKSIWTPIFKNRGVNTDNGASQACDPVVVAGLKDWL